MSEHSVGIQDFGLYVPKHFVPIHTLAASRGIETAKLEKGLGIQEMAVCAPEEDVALMAAEAIRDLVSHYVAEKDLDSASFFQGIDRIYLGTESSLDGAKPTITYALTHLQQWYGDVFSHIDFLDMTFACIGAVDALHQCLDYVRIRPERKCIVLAADQAVYDLHSGGEYTQGAGAVALLVGANPEIISFQGEVGVSCVHEFDFYKPKRKFRQEDIIKSLLDRLEIADTEGVLAKWKTNVPDVKHAAPTKLEGWHESFWDMPNYAQVIRDEPVFDGAYSNKCYEMRVSEALGAFMRKNDQASIAEFKQWVFHLPYAFQGRRMAVKLWWEYLASKNEDLRREVLTEFPLPADAQEGNWPEVWLKSIAKSSAYRSFVAESIAPTDALSSRVGNLYTASIFMAMLSGMIHAAAPIHGASVLFLAYGSGSKSKVFEGKYAEQLDVENMKLRIQQQFSERTAIDMDQYERWRRA